MDAATATPVFELADCEGVIIREIAAGMTQKQIAQSYALALRSSWPTDWAVVNKAIINRWSVSGLNRIKNLAWSGKCFLPTADHTGMQTNPRDPASGRRNGFCPGITAESVTASGSRLMQVF